MRVGDYFIFLLFGSFLVSTFFNLSLVSPLESFFFVLFRITKSAQLPFSGWLPKAMRAPTPTSALVHRSTLVTAGLVVIITYREILIRKTVINLLCVVGFTTIVLGSVSALAERRIKKIVAYSTMSQIGLGAIVYGLGFFHLGYVNLIAHGFAKSLLFVQVGYLIHMSFNQQNYRK